MLSLCGQTRGDLMIDAPLNCVNQVQTQMARGDDCVYLTDIHRPLYRVYGVELLREFTALFGLDLLE